MHLGLKDYFNKPSIVITNSNEILKASARSIHKYNLGRAIKIALDKNLILNGVYHSMAAPVFIKRENLTKFEKFINNFLKKNFILILHLNMMQKYHRLYLTKIFIMILRKLDLLEMEILFPYHFFFRNLKVIKSSNIKSKTYFLYFKVNTGYSINSIAFDSFDNKIGKYILNYKKKF